MSMKDLPEMHAQSQRTKGNTIHIGQILSAHVKLVCTISMTFGYIYMYISYVHLEKAPCI